MGKYRPFIFLGVAVIIALITSVLIYNFLQRKARVKEVALETLPIAVAKVDLNWGTVISKEVIEMKPFLKKTLPGGYFSDLSFLTGRVLISPVKANEPIFESKLAPTTIKTGGVAAVVSPKKRAVAVKVDKVIGVAGFIYPGNRVDVLVTIATQKTSEPITKIVLENILVLAAGPEIQAKGKEEKATPVDVITLEVTPEEAEKLALAATEGKLQLALRNFIDTEDVHTRGITIPALLAGYSAPKETKPVTRKGAPVKKPAPAVTKAPEEKKPPVFVVELIKGTKASEVKFERSE
jgi:pilus assembly protein CpaB